ncbi:MAG TPA: hypothetical protein VM912_01890 [Terriglobales bacterium]|nr:hypothetical protein [Terriglobales bacterium]
MKKRPLSRRRFLQVGALSLGGLGLGSRGIQSSKTAGISLVIDPTDPIASMPAAKWAAEELTSAISQAGVAVSHFSSINELPNSDLCVQIAGTETPAISGLLKTAGARFPSQPESLVLAPSTDQGKRILLACGKDARGLMYALLELADRVRHGGDPRRSLAIQKAVVEQPFNEVRSIGRLFVSDVEDKSWFNDREMWPPYFSMLATHRFNQFSLNLGIGFDSLQNVTDSYFLFAYPFLLDVPGYRVRAATLPDAERDRNLEMLQFISRQAVAHGIDFRLGIWTHGYQWADTPHSNYTIEGLTPENHPAYSRDALSTLLKACPDISGITLRTHGESGVREGSYDFWKTVLEGVQQAGRKVEIDLHPKGLDQRLLDSALATGMPVRLSPKYWAEHMGLPYQQTAIRELEMPREKAANNFYALSTGSRIFTRYGYADFLREDRPYRLIYRIWPGTHRFLLWGDPVSSAAHARAFRFCGSNGVELYEPLSFKGRRGSGLAGGRCAYADSSLNPGRDWEKYLYTYRVWGRLLYNPDSDPEVWRRQVRRDSRSSAASAEAALGAATRIVPLITTAHLPSAANDTYGPEFYVNQPIVKESATCPYHDTPSPRTFGNVSPLDPEMFSCICDFAAEMLKGERSGKYTPLDVAQWLESFADVANRNLQEAEKRTNTRSPEFRRMAIDVKIQIGLGCFFAAKLRAGTLYAIHEQSGDRGALEQSLKLYRQTRDIWAAFARETSSVYASDISYGPRPYQRGHWMDRLPAIDEDIAAMAKRLETAPETSAPGPAVRSAIAEALGRPPRPVGRCSHRPPERFVPKQELPIVLSIEKAEPISGLLYYRHVNQAERYQTVNLQAHGSDYRATIPASYTDSPYPLQYYFELRRGPTSAWLYPGFDTYLMNQPYFVVRQKHDTDRADVTDQTNSSRGD